MHGNENICFEYITDAVTISVMKTRSSRDPADIKPDVTVINKSNYISQLISLLKVE